MCRPSRRSPHSTLHNYKMDLYDKVSVCAQDKNPYVMMR